jgi:hypothetical protein
LASVTSKKFDGWQVIVNPVAHGIEEFVAEMLVRLNLTSRPKIHAGREPLPGKLDNLMFRLFMAHSGHFG